MRSAVCKVGTAEVVKLEPPLQKVYQLNMCDNEDRAFVDGKESMTLCIDICRLTRHDRPTCTGFVHKKNHNSFSGVVVACIPLLDYDSQQVLSLTLRGYMPEAEDQVDSVAGCTDV